VSELEAFLAEQTAYQSAGRGTFTVDPARQRELLGRLGLTQSELGFLKWAQGAYRSGALELKLRADPGTLTLSFPLSQPPRQPLWEGDCLALGLLSLSQDYQLDWSWQFADQQVQGEVREHRFDERSSRIPGGRLPDQEGRLQLHVSKGNRSWWQRGWTAPIRKLLARRLTCMPMTVTWNGDFLNQNLHLSKKAEAFVYCGSAEVGDLWLGLGSSAAQRRIRCGDLEGEQALEAATRREIGEKLGYMGWAALGASGSSWSETTFVLDGVALDKESNLLDRPGIVAVVSAAGLNTDLGGLQLIHDQAFRERLQGLRSEVRWLDSINQRGR
jgi:hypothetical protein